MIDVALCIGIIAIAIGVFNLSKRDTSEPVLQFIAGSILVALCLCLGDKSVVIKTLAQWVVK